MRRREFIGLVGSAGVAFPLAARAQKSGKVYRIGKLAAGTLDSRKPLYEAFMHSMRELGYVEGQNLVIEQRHADDHYERLPGLTQELLSWQPDVLLVSQTPAALAAKAASSSVPIVMVSVSDPLGVGLIASLPRPGSNITGITDIGVELAGKRLEILKEVLPGVAKVAVLINPDIAHAPLQMDSLKPVADKLGVELDPILHVRHADDLKGVFAAAVQARAGAGLRMVDPTSSSLRMQTVALAAEHRLPVIYAFRQDVLAGGLISYGPNQPDQYRQAATFVHKILLGIKPADLPVEQPVRFELILNLKTAKALGLTISPTLLARADEVIE
jgi:putative tryptophan/tyrosine transport system substrate-binding protein